MKKVFYVSYYDSAVNAQQERSYFLAATNKMDYICSAMKKNGYDIEIVSASGTKGTKKAKSKTYENDFATVKLFSSIGRGNKLKNALNIILVMLQLFFYLLFRISKDETVIVYHSLGYMSLISLLKSLKRFKMILEVEEIYSDVTGDKKKKDKELRFFKKADGYIFPTELLNEKVNTDQKPHIIIYGTYMVEKKRETVFSDGRIHCVYAGTLDSRKGGALAAARSAAFLNNNYYVHIIGFGTEDDLNLILNEVEENKKKGLANLSFDGKLEGEEYFRFIGSCDVGLSTQSPLGEYNVTSFPSKVLSYLANGLRVVSVNIEVVRRSKVSSLIYYCEDDTPEKIAQAIKEIDYSDNYNSRSIINALDSEFCSSIKNLLQDV